LKYNDEKLKLQGTIQLEDVNAHACSNTINETVMTLVEEKINKKVKLFGIMIINTGIIWFLFFHSKDEMNEWLNCLKLYGGSIIFD
jgi:hypothetical protein